MTMMTASEEDGMSIASDISRDDISTSSRNGGHTLSTESFSSNTGTKNTDVRETTRMLQKDKWVRSIRVIALAVIVIAAVVVSMVEYSSLRSRSNWSLSTDLMTSRLK